MRAIPLLFLAIVSAASLVAAPSPAADEKADDHHIVLGEGAIQLTFPESWQRKQPENNIVEYEFAVPASEGEKDAGRVTVMGASGSIDANIERWITQFPQPDGSDTHKIAKVKESKVNGLDVRVVELSGTYKDNRGPFSGIPVVERPKYKMLAAILSSKKGNYFVKFYGGQQTVTDNEKAFQKLIDSIKAN